MCIIVYASAVIHKPVNIWLQDSGSYACGYLVSASGIQGGSKFQHLQVREEGQGFGVPRGSGEFKPPRFEASRISRVLRAIPHVFRVWISLQHAFMNIPAEARGFTRIWDSLTLDRTGRLHASKANDQFPKPLVAREPRAAKFRTPNSSTLSPRIPLHPPSQPRISHSGLAILQKI